MKRKTTLAIAACLILMLTGSGCGIITPQELINAEKACSKHKGIRELKHYPLMFMAEVRCMDGTYTRVSAIDGGQKEPK